MWITVLMYTICNMHIDKKNFIIGIIIILIPLLGLPLFWKFFLLITVGVAMVISSVKISIPKYLSKFELIDKYDCMWNIARCSKEYTSGNQQYYCFGLEIRIFDTKLFGEYTRPANYDEDITKVKNYIIKTENGAFNINNIEYIIFGIIENLIPS